MSEQLRKRRLQKFLEVQGGAGGGDGGGGGGGEVGGGVEERQEGAVSSETLSCGTSPSETSERSQRMPPPPHGPMRSAGQPQVCACTSMY